MYRLDNRRYGIFLVATSAVLWSTAGLFVRMADLDTWTVVAWRSLFSCLTLGCIAIVQNRGNLARTVIRQGLPGAFSIGLSTVSTISYVMALRLTTVANVMIIYAALPFIATVIAFLWLREQVTARFLVAGTIAIVGIVIMARAAATPRDLAGIIAAFVMTTGFATQLVLTKRNPTLDTTVNIALTAGVCGLVTVPFMHAGIPAPKQLLACALFGVLTTGLAYILVLKGGRLISAGEAGFISMLDVVLGPFWVWLFFAERPTVAVIGGGTVVLGSVIWYLITDRKRSLPLISTAEHPSR